MSFQTANNNNFVTAPTSPNPYISQKLNGPSPSNEERERGLDKVIPQNVERMLKDMKKIAEETSTTVTEMEGTILMASVNNRTMNATNITQIAEDLWYLVQSDMNE